MSALMEEMNRRALALGVPLGVQLDVTYRCNERCVHCYLDHDDHGEMTTAEIMDVLDQLAEAGRLLPHLERRRSPHAHGFLPHPGIRALALFCVKVKTNAFMIREKEADRMRELGVQVGAGQHLLAPAGSARRHHPAAAVARSARSRASACCRRAA